MTWKTPPRLLRYSAGRGPDIGRSPLRAATEAGANAIFVTSFNQWPETTIVEPLLVAGALSIPEEYR